MRVAGPVVMYRCVLLFAWFGPGWPLPAAERMPTPQPVREYAREHEVTGVSLSPDGRTLAYQVGEDRTWVLQFRDWDSGKVTTVNAGAAPGVPLWLGPDRVLYGRGASVDRTGRNAALNGPAPGTVLFHRFAGARSDEVLAQAHELPVPGAYQEHYIPRYSHVDRVNTRLGRSIREVENPGQIVLWLADGRGAVAVGVRDDGIRHAVVRQTEPAGAWTPLAGLEDILYRVRVHGLSGDGRTLWLTRPDEKGRWALYAYDVAKQAFAELLLAHDYFDILPNLVVSPRDRELLGVRWLADKPGTFWLHGELAGVQQALDKALPGTVNHIVSLSDDLQRMVVLAVSARNPGVYFQFDRAKVELKPLFAVRPWVDPRASRRVSSGELRNARRTDRPRLPDDPRGARGEATAAGGATQRGVLGAGVLGATMCSISFSRAAGMRCCRSTRAVRRVTATIFTAAAGAGWGAKCRPISPTGRNGRSRRASLIRSGSRSWARMRAATALS
jgi:hypothetical protein